MVALLSVFTLSSAKPRGSELSQQHAQRRLTCLACDITEKVSITAL